MSNVKASDTDSTSFTERLGIQTVTPKAFRTLLDCLAGTRVVLAAMGPSGIGKTAIPKQAAKDRRVPYVVMFMPMVMVEDFAIPTLDPENPTYFKRRIPVLFKPLFDYIEDERKKHPGGQIPRERCPILALEELNRAPDRNVIRAAFVLIDDRRIGDVELPPEVQIVVTMNPSGNGMAVSQFETDPAMRRRLNIVGMAPSYGDFINHAREVEFHPKVIAHLEAQPTLLYDTLGAHSGRAFACPATWQKVSELCTTLDKSEVPLTSQLARAVFSGAIGDAAAELFIEYIKDATIVITPQEVLQNFRPGTETASRFEKFVNDNRQDKIGTLVSNVALHLFANTPDMAKNGTDADRVVPQLAHFMQALPPENVIVLVRALFDASKNAPNGTAYLQRLNQGLVQYPAYVSALDLLQKKQAAAKKEADGD